MMKAGGNMDIKPNGGSSRIGSNAMAWEKQK
jgi:hypothetical protein